jgi:hypothetical protein
LENSKPIARLTNLDSDIDETLTSADPRLQRGSTPPGGAVRFNLSASAAKPHRQKGDDPLDLLLML